MSHRQFSRWRPRRLTPRPGRTREPLKLRRIRRNPRSWTRIEPVPRGRHAPRCPMGGLGSNRNEAAILAFSVLGQRLEFECADATLTELVVADSPGLPCDTDGRAQGCAL